MSRVYEQKSFISQKKTPAQSAAPSTFVPSNSAMAGALGIGDQASTGLEAQMLHRMEGSFQRQRPAAEREADSLAQSVDASASPEEVKQQLGQQLGADFSDVRLHTDAASAHRADAMGAQAFAQGRDVYFGSEGFQAQTAAHELVHTVQQGMVQGSGVQVSAPAGSVQMSPKSWIKSLFGGKKEVAPPISKEAQALRDKKIPRIKTEEEKLREKREEEERIEKVKREKELKERIASEKSHHYKKELLLEPGTLQPFNSEKFTTPRTDFTPKKAERMEPGKFDDRFADMDNSTKAAELAKLRAYLTNQRILAGKKGLNEDDQALEGTYKSVLQQATGNDDFLKTLITQTGTSAKNFTKVDNAYFDAHSTDVDERYSKGGAEEAMKRSKQHSFLNVGLTDEANEFQAYHQMLEDASKSMDEGQRKSGFDYKRDYFKGVHANKDGSETWEERMEYATGALRQAKGLGTSLTKTGIEEQEKARREEYSKGYALPGNWKRIKADKNGTRKGFLKR